MDYYYDYDIPRDAEGAEAEYEYDSEGDGDPTLSEDPPHLLAMGNVFQDCVIPSSKQIAGYVVMIIGWSLVCRLLWVCVDRLLHDGNWLKHLTSIACGFATLYFTTGHNFLIVVFLSLVAYIFMLSLEYRSFNSIGIIIAIVSISSHFAYELLWNKPQTWQNIRGIQMVATMKIISLAFDLKPTKQKETKSYVPGLVPYLGYLFCPATCVLGPWIPYNAYLRSVHFPSLSGVRWLLWLLLNALLAVIALNLSNCVVPLICSNQAWIWLRTYRDALSVRCSHYFICFLSQASISAGGISMSEHAMPNKFLGHMVTKPWLIEFPHSMRSIVRYWNVPMHDWLKMYIFRGTYNRFGNYLIAIISTYMVSSLLHGFHLKIYLVLLSLACFTYVENVLRAKLADIFNACITAAPCRQPCRFKFCPSLGLRSHGAVTVLLFNTLFKAFAIFHLAYLGVMMNSSDEDSYDFSNTTGLWRWSHLSFINHWVVLVTYVFYCLI